MLKRIKPVAQEKYIKSLVTGGPDSQQMNKAFMQTMGIEFAHEHFIAVVIAVDNSLKWDHLNMNPVQISFMSTFKDNLKASIEDSGYSNYIIQAEGTYCPGEFLYHHCGYREPGLQYFRDQNQLSTGEKNASGNKFQCGADLHHRGLW